MTVTAGSVIAETTVVLPAAIDSTAVSAAVSDLAANLEIRIMTNAVLAAFGPIDPPRVSRGTVSVEPADVKPVISDIVTLDEPRGRLGLQTGSTVVLGAMFVETTDDGNNINKAAVSVTGFTASDVVAVAELDSRTLPVNLALEVVSTERYRLFIIQAAGTALPEGAPEACEEWELTVSVPAGAALTMEGDSTRASTATVVPWRPGPDHGCVETDADSGNVRSACAVLTSHSELHMAFGIVWGVSVGK